MFGKTIIPFKYEGGKKHEYGKIITVCFAGAEMWRNFHRAKIT